MTYIVSGGALNSTHSLTDYVVYNATIYTLKRSIRDERSCLVAVHGKQLSVYHE